MHEMLEPHGHCGRYQIYSRQTQLSSSIAEYNEETQPGENTSDETEFSFSENNE